MSTRALKKLTRKDDLKQLEEIQKKISTVADASNNEDEDDNDDEDICNTKSVVNHFDLLCQGEESEENKPTDEEDAADGAPQKEIVVSKKKTKKKKKRANKAEKENEKASSSFKFISSIDDGDLDEYNDAEENEDHDDSTDTRMRKEMTQQTRKLLLVEPKYLNYDNEMIRMFGARIVQNERNANQRASGGGARRQANSYRQNCIVSKKPTWPPFSRIGLSMRIVEDKENEKSNDSTNSANAATTTKKNKLSNDNVVEFAFEHSNSYQNLQFAFMDAVESLDHNNIVQVIHICPYHVDSLIQMSEVSRIHDDSQMSADLIERSLFAIQNSFHSSFNFVNKSNDDQKICYLNYAREENRCLFVALFKHILNISSKACYRTSLELCKLLLSLDVQGDPLGVILLIDLYAIRSSQYTFLIDFFDSFNACKHLHLMPNMAMSCALAHFNLSKELGAKNRQAAENHLEMATKQLRDALIKFPYLLMELLDKCDVVADKQVEKSRIFAKTSNLSVPQGLKYLIDLYVLRMYHEWKLPDSLQWLEKTVKDMVTNEESLESSVNEYKKKFKSLFTKVPSNIYRHLILSDYKEIPVNLPPEFGSSATYVFNPVPPKNSIVSYTRPVRPQSNRSNDMNRSDSFFTFFQSLLPNFNLQEQAQARQHIELAARGQARGRGRARARAGNNDEADDEAAAIALAAAEDDNGGDRFDMRQMVNRLRDFFVQIQDSFPVAEPLQVNNENNNNHDDDNDAQDEAENENETTNGNPNIDNID